VRNSAPLKAERLEVGSRLWELQALTKNATLAPTPAHTMWAHTQGALAEAEAGLKVGHRKQIEQRAQHAKDLLELRKNWKHLPRSWRRQARRASLVAEHQNTHQVDLRVHSLEHSLA